MTDTLAESLARRLREVDPDVRSAIRVEAMREIEKVVADEWEEWAMARGQGNDDNVQVGIHAAGEILDKVREKIAKEQSNG